MAGAVHLTVRFFLHYASAGTVAFDHLSRQDVKFAQEVTILISFIVNSPFEVGSYPSLPDQDRYCAQVLPRLPSAPAIADQVIP